MRILCLERDNVTQPSETDNNGDVYTASFELFPFYEGSTYSHYKGLLNGDGTLRGNFCVVRTLLDKVAERTDWLNMMKKATEAQRLAAEFNKVMGYKAITFQIPILARIDTLSDFACLFRCFKPHDKRLDLNEFVVIEPFLDGPFQKFDSSLNCTTVHASAKSISKSCAYSRVDSDSSDSASPRDSTQANSTSVAQSFSHFTWHFTRTHVVCDLQGVSNGQVYKLTNPTIHSITAQFGGSDGSVSSIAEFFSYHRCNNICRSWEKCSRTGKPQRNVNFFHKPENLNEEQNKSQESTLPNLLHQTA